MSELELLAEQTKLLEVLESAATPGRHAARSAVNHLKKAWLLRDVDKEMALFRAITAEEEAATAIFRTLRRHEYPGSERLHYTSHQHKQALVPFLAAISSLTERLNGVAPGMEICHDTSTGNKWIRLYIVLEIAGERRKAIPEPPLNFEVSSFRQGAQFAEQMKAFAERVGVPKVLSHVKQRARRRDGLLYATAQGYPTVTGDVSEFIKSRQNDVFFLLAIFLLIDPYPTHQLFVVQCLQELLIVLEALPRDEPA